MSAYGHEEMEQREDSAQSLPSREVSVAEMGSRYTSETGLFLSSFAATVFISGLVILGVSLLSLLVALAVLLQSCESRNSGVLEMYRNTNSYNYCRNFALHAELNSLGADSFPAICKVVDTLYIKNQYKRDLNITFGMAEDFFNHVRPQNDGRDVVLMDADDLASETLYSYQLLHRNVEDLLHNSSRYANYMKQDFLVKFYLKLQYDGWPLILFSRKPLKLHEDIEKYLTSMGCCGWSSLIMRMENDMQMDFHEFLSRQRNVLQSEGIRIIAVISSEMDALRGPCLGDRVFKIPKPIFRSIKGDHGGS